MFMVEVAFQSTAIVLLHENIAVCLAAADEPRVVFS